MAIPLLSNVISQISGRGSNLETPKGLGARARPESRAQAKALGPKRMRHVDLAAFESIQADIPADITWRPGPQNSAFIECPESFLRHLRLEITGRKLIISSSIGFTGSRVRIELIGSKLMEVHLASSASLEAQDLEVGRLIATVREKAYALFSGEVAEAHFEAMDESCLDAASLNTFIAIAEISGSSVAFVRAREAIEAELRDAGLLLTVGQPKMMDARRYRIEAPTTLG